MPDSNSTADSTPFDSRFDARFDLNSIETALRSQLIGRTGLNELWDIIDSSSTRAAELAGKGAPEGVFVIARQQSAGRGRQGKTWLSKADSGIYISFILRPPLKSSVLPLASFAVGLATAEAIEATLGITAGIKWVNDLIFDGRKLGGILCEIPGQNTTPAQQNKTQSPNAQTKSAATPPLIIGIGINLNLEQSSLPDELQGRVASLDQICGKAVDANTLIAELCLRLEFRYEELKQGGAKEILDAWKERSVTLGKQIKAISGNQEIFGQAIDIAQNGALIVRDENGQEIHLHAGEISLRLADGSYA